MPRQAPIGRASDRTTRTATHPLPTPPSRDPSLLLQPGELIAGAGSPLRYEVQRLLGAGGFGQAYLARRLGKSSTVPAKVCVKVSARMDGWVREAYFGQLLEGHARAIQVYDAFVLIRPGDTVLYCLVLEYACHGDLSSQLARTGSPWREAAARREIAGVLDVLGRLHRGQLLHRDLTPMNVFVCEGGRLKLGDFGIVRQQSDRRGITASTLNAFTAPSDIVAGEVPKWQARDDVYQVGQLLAMLVRGDARRRLRPGEVRLLPCSDQLKEIIHRCVGERRKRYESADELIAALRTRPASLSPGTLRSLAGVHLAFTGILGRPRREAIAAAERAGAVVHRAPSVQTTALVRGAPNPLQAAGREAGLKLMEIKRLRERGHRITLLSERQFWRLCGDLRPAGASQTQVHARVGRR